MDGTAPIKSKVKILQHNRQDAGFFSVKLSKQPKNCTSIFEGKIKILGTGFSGMDGNCQHKNFFTAYQVVSQLS